MLRRKKNHIKHSIKTGEGARATAGLHPTDLQALCLPSFKTKERAQSQQQRHQWFNGRGELQV